jgi:hypothetical protein
MTPHHAYSGRCRRNTGPLLSSALLSGGRCSALGQMAGTDLHPFPSSLCSMIARAWARAACASRASCDGGQ